MVSFTRNIGQISDGINSSKYFKKSGVPVIRGNNLSNTQLKFIDEGFVFVTEEKAKALNAYAIEDDLIFTAAGTIGQVGIIEGNTKYKKYVISNKQLRVRLDKNKVNPLYAYYWFSSPWIVRDIINKNTGSTVPLINLSIIKSLEINIPKEKNIQDKIVLVLDSISNKIVLNNRINAELEAMAKTLYDYWFVQFDFPFDFAQGKPDAKGKPYKSSGGKMVWNEELKREIPEGWFIENLKNNSLSELIKPNVERFEGQKVYLATADVENSDINLKADKITYENRESRANMQPIANSIWFAKMKNSKKVLYFADYSKEYINNYILSTGFAGIKCEMYTVEYLWNFINNKNFEFIKDRLSNGATQEAINNESMSYIHLVVPQNDIIESFHNNTNKIYNLIYVNQIENQKLSELRDWLLPMLMNGQVKVE